MKPNRLPRFCEFDTDVESVILSLRSGINFPEKLSLLNKKTRLSCYFAETKYYLCKNIDKIMSRLSKDVQMRRCLWIVETLLTHRKGMSYDEMMEEWRRSAYNDFDEECIPKRSFGKYLNDIESYFQVSIRYDAHCGRYFLTDPEEIYNDEFKNRLVSGFAINNILNGSEKLRHRIMTENIPSGEKFLLDVLDAMQRKRCLNVIYQRFGGKEAHTSVLEPYFLKLFHRRWYMVAKIPDVERLRVYSLDRVKDMEVTNQTFAVPTDIDVRTFFFDCFGIEHNTDDYDVEDIKLKVYNTHNKCQYLRALPLHHSQKELERHDDYSIFQLTVYPTYDFMQEILSHGNEIEVIEPLWVRNEFKKKIAVMSARYSK